MMVGLLGLLALGTAPAGQPVARAVPGKPGGPVLIEAVSVEESRAAGRFTAEVRVTALAEHEGLELTAWGAPGIRLDGGASMKLGPGPDGREARWILFGEWTGQGPPRLYVRAALLSGGMLLSRQLSVTVSESATWLQTEGWLDSENGLLIFEVE